MSAEGDLYTDHQETLNSTDATLWTEAGDRAHTDVTGYPGAPEVAYDGIDQDWNGADLADVDGDHSARVRSRSIRPG